MGLRQVLKRGGIAIAPLVSAPEISSFKIVAVIEPLKFFRRWLRLEKDGAAAAAAVPHQLTPLKVILEWFFLDFPGTANRTDKR
jgi:hypothetical protein